MDEKVGQLVSDFMPTLCELASAKLPDVTIDGTSFAPQL